LAKKEQIGLIGTGLFGSALAERLLADGYPLLVFNRTREKADPLLARGANWSDNPLTECRRVIFCLYTSEQVAQVWETLDRPGNAVEIILDTSTSDPQQTITLGRQLAKHGVEYLEAPFSGSSEQARNHQATGLVAGRQSAFDKCADLWECLAAKTYYVGEWGNAARMKLVTNLALGLNRAVLAEALVFADAIGLGMEISRDVLLNSPAYSRVMDAKGPKMVQRDFSPQARLAQHLKDIQLMITEADRAGIHLPLSAVHSKLLEHAVAAGWGELDNSAVICSFQDPNCRIR
jgi:3-hydroxyisobutyrate dehydrogenase-like beta-hydroxyacid dehydrogenase